LPMKASEKALRELRRPVEKRDVGGHGDHEGFAMLLAVAMADLETDFDLFEIDLPKQKVCSTCRFLVPEFNERMPCWTCITEERLPKWRPR
jgi:hypothetical protein